MDGILTTDRWVPWKGDPPKDSHLIRTLESKGLAAVKEEITTYYEQGQWDDYKKITNPYEYIFLSWNRRTSRSVANRSPLSRSYFKMIELWKLANLNNELKLLVAQAGALRTVHTAEGPGGFLEAMTVMAEKNKWTYESCRAMTLRSTNKHIPGWRKAVHFLETNPMVQISYGADDTGDLLKIENRTHFINECKEKAHLYTADGGFDFSGDYNGQEDSIFSLLVAEILVGVQTLALGGVMIVKCFDTTEKQTLDVLWALCSLFREWSFVKPRTSRAGNAERYFIGKGFLGASAGSNEFVALLQASMPFQKGVPLLQNSLPKLWLQTMWEIQEGIEREEYRIIRDTIHLITHASAPQSQTQIRRLVRQNVIRSMEWCIEHDEAISEDWTHHLDRYVAQEVVDLFHILKQPFVSPSWSVQPRNASIWSRGSSHEDRSHIDPSITFEGFRASNSSSIDGWSAPVGGRSTSSRVESLQGPVSHSDRLELSRPVQRRYVDLFSRPRRPPTVEASSLVVLPGKIS